MQGLVKCHSRVSIFLELMTKVNKNLTIQCKNISTCSRNYQLNQTRNETIQQHEIIDIYEELPTKFQSLNRQKDIDVNLNVRTVYKPDWSPTDPVVLALHGMPGDAGDFEQMSYSLAEYNVKFVMPDFPGFGRSVIDPGDVYNIDYSPAGKVSMLNRILDKLELDRVDVLVSHSAGSFLGFRAAAEIDRIISAAFLNFLGGKPHRYARPLKLLQWNAKLMKTPVMNPLYISMLPKVYESIGFARYEPQPLQVAVQNVATAEYEKILDYVEIIKNKKMPTVFAWATTDKVVEIDIPLNIMKHVGIRDSHIIKLCRENKIKQLEDESAGDHDQVKDWYFKAIQFDRGGHLLQKTQIPELTKHITDLINHVRR